MPHEQVSRSRSVVSQHLSHRSLATQLERPSFPKPHPRLRREAKPYPRPYPRLPSHPVAPPMGREQPPGGGHGPQRPGDGRGTPPPDPPQGSPNPASSDGQKSTGDAHISGDRENTAWFPRDLSAWSGFWAMFGKVPDHRVKAVVTNSPASLETDLPRLSAYVETFYGPPMSRAEEDELKQHLESVLKQLQYSVKSMGLQPVDIQAIQPSMCLKPVDLESIQPVPSWLLSVPLLLSSSRMVVTRGRMIPLLRSAPTSSEPTESLLKQKESLLKQKDSLLKQKESLLEQKDGQINDLVKASDQLSFQMKMSLAAALASKNCSPEFAQEVGSILQCMEKNVEIALHSGGHFFTLAGLLKKVKLFQDKNGVFADYKNYGRFALHIATMLDRAIRCYATTHVQFNAFGKETDGILDKDYTIDKLNLSSNPFNNVSFAMGVQAGGDRSVGQLVAKFKHQQNSISFTFRRQGDVVNAAGNAVVGVNAAINDILSTKIKLDKPLGADLKCSVQIPYPSYNGKFEVRGVFPYVVCAGGLQLNSNPGGAELPRIPVIDFSAVLGMKYAGLGYRFQFSQGQLTSTFGMSVRTKLLAVGLKSKSTGHFNATFCKELVDSSTTIAGRLAYVPHPVQNQAPLAAGVIPGFSAAIGLKHAIDPTLYLKARVGNDGASVLVKKSSSTGSCSVKGAMHVDFANVWRLPKVGVLFSWRW